MDYVITLSSDEESETPAKKRKINSDVEDSVTVVDENTRVVEGNPLVGVSVIKKTDDQNSKEIKAEKSVESEKKTDICNGLNNGSTSTNAVAVEDCADKKSETPNQNSANSDNHNASQSDDEICDYFNLSSTTKDDNITDALEIDDNRKNNDDSDKNQEPSTSKTPNPTILEAFLETCTNSIKKSLYETRLTERYDKIKSMYLKCTNIDSDEEFLDKINTCKSNALVSPADAVLAFREIYEFIHDYMKSTLIEIPSENVDKVKKLEKTIKLLLKTLKRLESKEIDLSKDDDDSDYVKIDRYSNRLNKVYQKYCELTNTDPHSGRLLHQKINLTASKYNEINKAVAKSYKYNKFPSYLDIEKVVRKCVEKHQLQLTEYEIAEESKRCFKKLGTILQSRRKQELHDNLSIYISDNDPATKDTDLDQCLRKNHEEGEKKIQDIIEKYAKMEETNVDGNVSEDSNDSQTEDEDDKNEDSDDTDCK